MEEWLFGNFSPVIKVVSAGCNLRCTYCFYSGHQPKIKIMDDYTLNILIKSCLEISPFVKFIWHGGEPTIPGIKFYRQVVEYQNLLRHSNQKIMNGIQTNATLVNKELAEFFRDNHFSVGVSLDGPEKLHNFARKNNSDKGSYNQVMRGVITLKEAGIKFGAIAVINSFTVHYPDEIFYFMHDLGLSFSANNCTAKQTDPIEIRNLAITSKQYTSFLLRLFDLWIKLDDRNFRINPLDDIVRGVSKKRPKLCKYNGICSRYITIDSNGDVYPCDEFLEEKYRFGNLINQSLPEILKSDSVQNYYSGRVKILASCQDCEWLNICNGGCMREWEGKKLVSNPKKYEFCKSRRVLFKSINKKLIRLGYNKKEVKNESIN